MILYVVRSNPFDRVDSISLPQESRVHYVASELMEKMFITLNLDNNTVSRDVAGTPAVATDDGGVSSNQDRPVKRNQVRRACDWCKLMRIKCDDDRPCSQRVQTGRERRLSGKNRFRSIAAAVKYDYVPSSSFLNATRISPQYF